MDDQADKSRRILIIFAFLLFALVIFVSVIYVKTLLPRKMPTLNIQKVDVALRGSIYTKDNYSLARSKKLYKLSFNPKSIDPDKKDLFVTLLEIYSDIPKSSILESFNEPQSYKTLSYSITPNIAANLKALNSKF